MPLLLNAIRSQFPALKRPAIFLDNPGGTQVARTCVERIASYLYDMNANHGGRFATSRASDASIEQAREAMADFLNAASPNEVIFGANMTTLTFMMSRTLGQLFSPGDTIVLTRMDHDANVSPWTLLARDLGLKIRFVDFHPENGTLDLADMASALQEKPRLVAFGYASNALGTVNPVEEITRMAHAAGALVYIDAVQWAPHGPIDVQKIGCDFLVCSAYKFFGPHLGALYGRMELLESLPAYKVRPAPGDSPHKFETGTGNFEHMAGTLGALEYLEWVGQTFGEEYAELYADQYSGRRLSFKQAMTAIHAYEIELNREMLAVFNSIPGARVYGITDPGQLDRRVPTFSLTIDGFTPAELAARLDAYNIYTWDGNFYALEVTNRLGLEDKGGLLRIGATHYNTVDEIHHLGEALREIVKG